MHRSRISCRLMFGTTQRHSVNITERSARYLLRLFPVPRAFEQRHASIETGRSNRAADVTLLLVQKPMHYHAVQHHHDRIRDLHRSAFINTGAHEMGGVSLNFVTLRVRCDALHPAASVEQFVVAGMTCAEFEMSCAGVFEIA